MISRQFIKIIGVAGLLALSGCGSLEKSFLNLGRPEAGAAVQLRKEALERFLVESQLNTPYISSAVSGSLMRGQAFREHVRDSRGRWTLATVWVDEKEADILHVQTRRNEACPQCKGSGARNVRRDVEDRVTFSFQCTHCKGAGELENYVQEKKYILSGADLLERGILGVKAGRRQDRKTSQVRMTEEQAEHVAMLTREEAALRLQACEWLDENFVKEGLFFNRIMPMLRKARWIEPNGGITVYQFWAGREEIPAKAYYRVYVDDQSGKVLRKGFVALAGEGGKRGIGLSQKVNDGGGRIKRWFTDGWDFQGALEGSPGGSK